MNEHRGAERAAALHALIDAVARGDLVEIGQLARQAVESALHCHQVLILRYDPERQRFVTTPILNQGTRFARQEVSIVAAECSWKDVFASHDTLVVRASEIVSSAERELLGDRNVVAFAFPVEWGTEVLGVIYAGAEQERELTEDERAAVEEVAALLALGLEKARVGAMAATAEHSAKQWRERYSHLFAHVEQPVIVVDLATDLIYEANPAMARLVGLSIEELHAMRLSALFWAGETPDWRSLLVGGPTTTPCKLRGSNGEPKLVSVEAAAIGDPGGDRALLIFHGAEGVGVRDRHRPPLGEAAHLLTTLDESGELEASIQSLFAWLGNELGATFGTLHVVRTQGQGLETRIARSLEQEEVSADVVAALAEGPFQRVFQAESIVECPSVAASRDYAELKPAAERAGYDAFIAAPLILGKRRVGVLTYFFPHARSFATEHKELFGLGARLLAFLLTWAEHQRRLEHLASGTKSVLDIVTGLWTLRSAEEIVAHVATQLQGRIPFDFFSVTLFEQGAAEARVLCLASPALADLVTQVYRWEQVAGTELGWLRPQGELEETRARLTLADKLGSRISVLLLARGVYIGNLSLGALGEEVFSREDVGLLRMLASPVAEALVGCGDQVSPQRAETSPLQAPLPGEPPGFPEEKSGAGLGAPLPGAAELRSALEALDGHIRQYWEDETLARQWQRVRNEVERLLLPLEEQGRGHAKAGAADAETLQPVSVSRLINEVTVELHRAGRLRDVQLIVIPGPPMEIVTRPELMAQALRELFDATLSIAAASHQPRVEAGYREQLLSKFIYLRYSGPAPDLSGMHAGDERWLAASERMRTAQQLIAQCGGKLTARRLLSGEVELMVTFAKAGRIGDG